MHIMNFLDVDINLLSYSYNNKNMKNVLYNKKKSLEIFTPLVFINTMKDSYSNEYIQLNLEEYDKFKDLIEYIDLHVMILNDISKENRDRFKSSLYNSLLSCKIPKNKGICLAKITINGSPSTYFDINKNDKAKCLIYIDTIWENSNTLTLKWKIKRCCVYRNEK